MISSGLHSGEKVRRFSPFRVIEHQIGMITFVILVVTGLSQRFHDYGFAQWIIVNIGGIDMVRLLHRYTGLTFAVVTFLHIGVAVYGVVFRKWPASMVINKNDFTDAIDNLRYYFGMTEHPARCDRYDYKQKFEYWGVVVGGLLMIATGVMLWFPTTIVRFLPGEFIPAAKAAHSNEALLAFLVIITWHLYNAIFSPEVFPLDTSIFTGMISVERMKHEHPIEYERMTGTRGEESSGEELKAGSGSD